MKAGKEEIVGLMAAVRWYLGLDHDQLLETYERQVEEIINAFTGQPCVSASRSFPSEAGQPNPRAELIFDEAGLCLSRDEILRRLYTGEPAIHLSASGDEGIYINPQTLQWGQEKIIIERIKMILSGQ
jgi:seryl-tRNA(Sec) selenium transferase